MEGNIFDGFSGESTIFRDRDVLGPSYFPQKESDSDVPLPGREREIGKLAEIVGVALRGEKPSNVMEYGKTGTGKTAVARYIGSEIERFSKGSGNKVDVIYVNCSINNNQYSILTTLANHYNIGNPVPKTGWSVDRVYNELLNRLDSEQRIIILELDEIDKLTNDIILYNLMEANSNLSKSKLSVIGISNNTRFEEQLDPRVTSRLSEEKIVYPPYNANQLLEILKRRAKEAFRESVFDVGALSLCAALAARDRGDARYALRLAQLAGEVAEREKLSFVSEKEVYSARQKLGNDIVKEAVEVLPQQVKIVAAATYIASARNKIGIASTGEIYEYYKDLCSKSGLSVTTQRRVTDLISELDNQGIVNARTVYKGRGGKTREVSLIIPSDMLIEAIKNDEFLGQIATYMKSVSQHA